MLVSFSHFREAIGVDAVPEDEIGGHVGVDPRARGTRFTCHLLLLLLAAASHAPFYYCFFFVRPGTAVGSCM